MITYCPDDIHVPGERGVNDDFVGFVTRPFAELEILRRSELIALREVLHARGVDLHTMRSLQRRALVLLQMVFENSDERFQLRRRLHLEFIAALWNGPSTVVAGWMREASTDAEIKVLRDKRSV